MTSLKAMRMFVSLQNRVESEIKNSLLFYGDKTDPTIANFISMGDFFTNEAWCSDGGIYLDMKTMLVFRVGISKHTAKVAESTKRRLVHSETLLRLIICLEKMEARGFALPMPGITAEGARKIYYALREKVRSEITALLTALPMKRAFTKLDGGRMRGYIIMEGIIYDTYFAFDGKSTATKTDYTDVFDKSILRNLISHLFMIEQADIKMELPVRPAHASRPVKRVTASQPASLIVQ